MIKINVNAISVKSPKPLKSLVIFTSTVITSNYVHDTNR